MTETKLKDFCITKIMPYNHSLHSQWEVGFIFILNPCLMPYIKLWWHSKWGTTRRVGSVGSSETHLISRTENEMFRGVLTNCCIFCNRMRSCEKLLQGRAWRTVPRFPLPVFYRGNKRMHIKIISFHITETKCHICKVLRLSLVALSLYLTILFSDPALIRLLQPFSIHLPAQEAGSSSEFELSVYVRTWQAAWLMGEKQAFNKWARSLLCSVPAHTHTHERVEQCTQRKTRHGITSNTLT